MRYGHYLKSIYVLIFLIFLVPRTVGLGSDIANYDSSYWYPRMQDFTKYLLRGDYKQTYQKYHPGVTLMWVSGTAEYVFENTFEAVLHFNPRYIPQQFTRLHFATKFPLVVIISFLGTLQFFYIRRLYDTKLAIIFAIMLSLEPFFLGVSRFLHLSALTAMFMFTSFLMLYYSLEKKGKHSKKLFYLSSIILGLGILTKIDALIAAPVNAILILYYGLSEKTKIKTLLTKSTFYFFLTFLTFYALFPAMWVAPFSTVYRMYFEGILDTAFNSDNGGAYSITNIKTLYYFEFIFLRSLPTTVIALIFGLYLNLRSIKLKKSNKFINWVIIYFFFNLIILAIPEKLKDRYLINLYPPIMIIAATAIYNLITLKNKSLKFSTLGIIVILYMLTIYRYHPVYSFYHTDFLGGPAGIQKIDLALKNRGEYYAQVAAYINKTDSEAHNRNVILSQREMVRSFAPFFYGQTFTNPKFMENGFNADYIVTRQDLDYLVPRDKCTLTKIFGPKDPFGYTMLRLYTCKNLTNDYKDFKN